MDVNSENDRFAEGASTSTAAERLSLDSMIAMVHPLCRGEGNRSSPDIAADIMEPAALCDRNGRLEVERLCAMFSFVLEYLGNTILSAIAAYFSTRESAHAIKCFVESTESLADTLTEAYDASVIEAFALRLREGLSNEPF
mgnify:CR=1 FL=1